jgi:phytoene desaturase
MHRVWRELGALSGKRVIDHEVFGDIVLPDGRTFSQYADVDRLVASLKVALAGLDGHDTAALDRLAADVKLWGKVRMPLGAGARGAGPKGVTARTAAAIRALRGMWKIRAFLPVMKRFGGSVEKYVRRFHSADLRDFFQLIIWIPRMPAVVLLMLLSALHGRKAGWPEGGSLGLAKSIARRYAELGGVIHYGARVEEIIVRGGRAVGVRLADGSEHLGDEVISAADGHGTLFRMLGGKYMSRALQSAYRRLPLFTPMVQVSFGVKRDTWVAPAGAGGRPELARLTTVQLDPPVRIGGTEVSFIMLNNYAFDATLAPRGRSALSVVFPSPWEHWERLTDDKEGYFAEKMHVLGDCMKWLESRLPGITADIEVMDVATPLTTVRYTGNYHASYQGWLPTPKTLRVKIDRRLPGLTHFSMVGQWTTPAAGLPTAAGDGRRVIQELCAQDGKEFRTTVPEEGRAAGPAAARRGAGVASGAA